MLCQYVLQHTKNSENENEKLFKDNRFTLYLPVNILFLRRNIVEEKRDNTKKKCHPRVMNLADRNPRAKKLSIPTSWLVYSYS